jgi:hypothetical protein
MYLSRLVGYVQAHGCVLQRDTQLAEQGSGALLRWHGH